MKRLSDTAIAIINDLLTKQLDYYSEYLPLIDALDRLAAYEDTELEPEEIEHIYTSYGRRMTLRTENGERLQAIKNIEIDRLRELARAEKDRRLMALRKGKSMMDKKILDVTCGSRSIWFDKHHPAALYCDKRVEHDSKIWKSSDGLSKRFLTVDPDIVCDFTNLPFEDDSFKLVVFDPPHLIKISKTSWLAKKYGKLDETWPQMLHDGFAECMRVLKPDGVLIFKWSEYDIPAEKVWKAIGEKPLFGHHSGKNSKTFWGCYMKLEQTDALKGETNETNPV